MDEILQREKNRVTVLGAITNDVAQLVRMLRVDPATGRLLVAAVISGGVVGGTIAEHQIAVGSATPNQIAGYSALTWNNTTQTFGVVGHIAGFTLDNSYTITDPSNNVYFEIDYVGKKAYFGDASGGWVNGAGIKVDGSAGTVLIGDILGNNTNFLVNKLLNTLSFEQSGYRALFISCDPTVGTAAIGDTLNSIGGTQILVNALTRLVTITNVPVYANDAAATGAGLTTGMLYKTTTLGTTALNIVP